MAKSRQLLLFINEEGYLQPNPTKPLCGDAAAPTLPTLNPVGEFGLLEVSTG